MTEPTFKTAQEAFWAGPFGEDYIERNKGQRLLASNLNFFSRALSQARGIGSVLEFGANIGMNLQALGLLFPGVALRGIEINAKAAGLLAERIGASNVIHGSIHEVEIGEGCDLALVKGVLIHLDPATLPSVYGKLVTATRRYLLVAEYYNPTPVTVPYRGETDRLFKRDFAGEILDTHPEMTLIDYGFAYRRDPVFPQDDITWFLLEKRG